MVLSSLALEDQKCCRLFFFVCFFFVLFFSQSKHAMFPSLCPLPDSPEAARREAIDYLAHKMDFVMFRVNIQHGKRLSH